MSEDNRACETPLLDLLRNVPADARLLYEHSPTHHQSIPVGVLAAKAADEIERLRTERDAAEARRQTVEDGFHRIITDGFDGVMALRDELGALRALLVEALPYLRATGWGNPGVDLPSRIDAALREGK